MIDVHTYICSLFKSLYVASKQKQYLGVWRNYRTPVEAPDSGDAERAKDNKKDKVHNNTLQLLLGEMFDLKPCTFIHVHMYTYTVGTQRYHRVLFYVLHILHTMYVHVSWIWQSVSGLSVVLIWLLVQS